MDDSTMERAWEMFARFKYIFMVIVGSVILLIRFGGAIWDSGFVSNVAERNWRHEVTLNRSFTVAVPFRSEPFPSGLGNSLNTGFIASGGYYAGGGPFEATCSYWTCGPGQAMSIDHPGWGSYKPGEVKEDGWRVTDGKKQALSVLDLRGRQFTYKLERRGDSREVHEFQFVEDGSIYILTASGPWENPQVEGIWKKMLASLRHSGEPAPPQAPALAGTGAETKPSAAAAEGTRAGEAAIVPQPAAQKKSDLPPGMERVSFGTHK